MPLYKFYPQTQEVIIHLLQQSEEFKLITSQLTEKTTFEYAQKNGLEQLITSANLSESQAQLICNLLKDLIKLRLALPSSFANKDVIYIRRSRSVQSEHNYRVWIEINPIAEHFKHPRIYQNYYPEAYAFIKQLIIEELNQLKQIKQINTPIQFGYQQRPQDLSEVFITSPLSLDWAQLICKALQQVKGGALPLYHDRKPVIYIRKSSRNFPDGNKYRVCVSLEPIAISLPDLKAAISSSNCKFALV